MDIITLVLIVSVILVLVGFIAIINFVNISNKNIEELRISLIEWQEYIQKLVNEEEL